MTADTIDYLAWETKLRSPEYNQGHLLDECADKNALITQLAGLEKGIPGGLAGYIQRSKELLVETKNEVWN